MDNEKQRARCRAYYAANKKKIYARIKKYRAATPDWKTKNNAVRKKWLENPKVRENFILRRRLQHRIERARIRTEFINAYGGACGCCGEKEPRFLTLDHVNGGGGKQRKNGVSTQALCGRLKRAGWPKGEYTLCCWNCNSGRHLNGGVCPHKSPLTIEDNTDSLFS